MPDFTLEEGFAGPIAGVDEVGRGPWAGPVVAAAVILPRNTETMAILTGLDDSKRLSAKRREALAPLLWEHAEVGLGLATVEEVDEINILRASLLAMTRAVAALPRPPAIALIDGNKAPTLACPAHCVVKGDGKSLSIAAASIVAKVARDRMMAELASEFPAYGWERNAGYGTKTHRVALERFGVTPHHRKSFAPIAKILGATAPRLLDIA